MRFHYVGVRYYVCLREWRMYASEISREISFISNTISMHLPSGSPSAHPAPKHLQSPLLPVAFLLLLHQYCGVVWYETTALTSVTVRLSVSNKCSSHLKLHHVNFWAVEYYSHSGWCSVNVSTDDIIPHSDSASLLMFWSKSWCDLITPVLLLWYSDQNQSLSVM